MKKIKTGIIGTGFSASAHIEALSRLPHVEIKTVLGSSVEKAQQLAKKYGIEQGISEIDELFSDPEIQVVHNCTPNHLHFTFNTMALKTGKHLISEKPLALNSKESAELEQLARDSNVLNCVCFNYRHFPLVRQMKEMIIQQELGKINLVYGGYLQDWLLYTSDFNWRMQKEFNGSSRAIADIGSHWCDTVQFILGKKIVKVFADLKTVHPIRKKPFSNNETFHNSMDEDGEDIPIDTEDYGSVLVHFEDGIQGVFTVSQVSAGRKNKLFFEIAGETGTLSWNQEEPNQLWIGKRNEANQLLVKDPQLLYPAAASLAQYPGGHQEGWPDGLKNLFESFYHAIQERQRNLEYHTADYATFQDGNEIAIIVDAILESHKNQSWVNIPVNNKKNSI
jgi:predicted dehydrogenase